MDGLMELAGRAIVEPERALEVAIAVAVDWRWDGWEEGDITAAKQAEKHGLDWLVGRVIDGMNSIWRGIPAYLTSRDAAMTLVAAGSRRVEFGTYDDGSAWAYVHTPSDVVGEAEGAHSEAAAITAAALRARAAIVPA